MRSSMRESVRSPTSPPSRSGSISSLNSPTASRFSLSLPPPVEPASAYVATSAASECIATARSQSIGAQEDNVSVSADNRPAVLTDEALAIINSFLDFLLYNILCTTRSTVIEAIRAAVESVVKGKLGQQAVAHGETELADLEYNGEENESTNMQFEHDSESSWDADMVWKRTRLKVMTYMRLSEVEDEEEDELLAQELGQGAHQAGSRYSQSVGPWATIFLTCAIERIAEQCLKDAGESAYNRLAISRPGTRDGSSDDPDVLTVTDQDIKKLALSQMVGRLWRQWKHTMPRGSPRTLSSPFRALHDRSYSNASDIVGGSGSRRPSNAIAPIQTVSTNEELSEQVVSTEPAAALQPKSPKSPRPISDQTANRRVVRHAPRRSRSFGRFPVAVPGRSDAGSWQNQNPRGDLPAEQRLTRARSSSLPPPNLQTEENLDASGQEGNRPIPASVSQPAAQSPSEEKRQEKRKSRRSRDMAMEAANNAARVAEADVAAVSGKRLSREARRSMRNSRDMKRNDVELSSEPAPEPERNENHLAPPSISTSGPSDDDEYDPFRADVTAPVPVKHRKAAPNVTAKPSSSAPPVQETLRTMSERDSADVSPHRSADATATLADGAVSTAILGHTSLRKSRKPAPLDMSASSTSSRSPRAEPSAQPGALDSQPSRPSGAPTSMRIRTQEPRDIASKEISPAQTTAGRTDEARTPSSSRLQRAATSDTSSATYETPRGSPSNFEPAGDQGSRPVAIQRSSDPNASMAFVKPISPKQRRPPSDGTSQQMFGRDGDKGRSLSPRSDRDFNELVSGNETVKRSLTPKTLMDIEGVESSRIPQEQFRPTAKQSSPVGTKPSYSESRSFSENRERPDKGVDASSSSSRSRKTSNIGALRQQAEARIAESGSRSPSSSKQARGGHVTKGAREQTFRTNEMADFIRSTGPDGPDQIPRVITTSDSVPSNRTPTSASPSNQNMKPSPTYQQPSSVKAVVPNTSRLAQKKKMGGFSKPERQANDDLISFLNEGPPGAHVNKTRSMETTSSRDNLGLGAISPNNRSSSQMSQSINESINSHSGLLAKHTAGPQAMNDRSPMMNASTARQPAGGGDSGLPMRKQRRNKDPYAIDTDDEDEDILTGLPPREEPTDAMGLVDFLRNTAPPEDNTPSGPGSRGVSPRGRPQMGTSSTAKGGPGPRPLHKPIPSNEEIKRDPRSDLALPHFLKEDRTVKPRESYDSATGPATPTAPETGTGSGRKKRESRNSDAGRGGNGGGMRGLFKRIGVNG